MNDRLRLAELLAIRLCHDLASPIGTLMGALAMAEEEPEARAEAIGLATDVATRLGRRLRLLRAAWGGAAASLSTEEIVELAEALSPGRRIAVHFERPPRGGRFGPLWARLVLNVLMLGAESLPSGGHIVIDGDPESGLVVRLAGPRAAWPPHLAAWLADPAAAWNAVADHALADQAVADHAVANHAGEASRILQGPLTALIAADAGIRAAFLMAREPEAAPPLILSPTP